VNPQYLPASFTDQNGNLTVSEQQAKEVSAGVQARVDSMPTAQKEIFLALVTSSNLAPSTDIFNSSNLTATLDKYEALSEKVTTTLSSTSTTRLLASAFVEMAASQRKQALEDRVNSRLAAKSELMDQASELKDAASKMMTGAIVSLVMTIVASAVTIGFSIAGGMKAGSALSKGGDAAASINIQAQSLASVGTALGQIGNSVGSGTQTMLQADSKKIEADAQLNAAQAEELKAESDIDKEFQQALNELIKHVIDFLKEIQKAEVEQMAAVTRG
jgi:hypothetical protein